MGVLHVSPGAILSLLATIFAGVVFILMLNETISLGKDRRP